MVRLFGRRMHPFLVVLPFGLLLGGAFFDLLHWITDNPTWSTVSYWTIGAGLVTGVIAALPGVMDWFAVRSGTRAKTTATAYGAGFLGALVLFAISWLMRANAGADPGGPGLTAPGDFPLLLSVIGGLVLLYTQWTAGELVERHAVGVDVDAGPNAPPSTEAHAQAGPSEEPTRGFGRGFGGLGLGSMGMGGIGRPANWGQPRMQQPRMQPIQPSPFDSIPDRFLRLHQQSRQVMPSLKHLDQLNDLVTQTESLAVELRSARQQVSERLGRTGIDEIETPGRRIA